MPEQAGLAGPDVGISAAGRAPPILETIGVSRFFPVADGSRGPGVARRRDRMLRAVDDVSLSIDGGTTLSLVGESGCGKTTIARLSVGLEQPSRGEIRFEGNNLSAALARAGLRSRLNMIFQDPYASVNSRWCVRDIVAEPIRTFGLLRSPRDIRDRVGELLEQVGLSRLDGERYPHEFSGGQRQRISIARALSGEPDFLVCDEPTSALDVSVQAQILNLMRDLQQRLGLTYLFISHNLAVVRYMSDRLCVMYLGRIVESGESETIFRTPRHPYTRMLLDAIPDPERIGRFHPPPVGEVPSAITPPTGCAFHPRCPLANGRCREEKPGYTLAGGALVACHAVEEGRMAA